MPLCMSSHHCTDTPSTLANRSGRLEVPPERAARLDRDPSPYPGLPQAPRTPGVGEPRYRQGHMRLRGVITRCPTDEPQPLRKRSDPATRVTTTRPSSSGWRSASTASRRNSVSSSRNRTP
jgi:hypothetical protein